MARHCSPLKKIDKKLQISLPKALPVSGLKSSKKPCKQDSLDRCGIKARYCKYIVITKPFR